MKKISLSIMALLMVAGLSTCSYAVPVFYGANGHWYATVSGNWTTAEANSIALGGHLVTINNAAEESWLRTTFGTSYRFWIGFNDIVSEGKWVWTSGEAVTYTHWNVGEPNNVGNEDWAVMNWNSSNGLWNDWWYTNCRIGIAEWGPPTPVPEPSSLLLVSTGLAGFAAFGLRTLRRIV